MTSREKAMQAFLRKNDDKVLFSLGKLFSIITETSCLEMFPNYKVILFNTWAFVYKHKLGSHWYRIEKSDSILASLTDRSKRKAIFNLDGGL